MRRCLKIEERGDSYRMKQRLERLEVDKILPTQTVNGDLARVEDCPADNRVRLFFPGKPDEATRSRLKSKGFRWSPTIGAWQAYRHNHTIETAKMEAGLAPKTPLRGSESALDVSGQGRQSESLPQPAVQPHPASQIEPAPR